jgi:DNA gyrase subunit A
MPMERQKIVPIFLEDEMRNSYLDYSMSVITNRALPDVRDGLKPSNRRILVAMNDLRLSPGRPHRKCAKICGDTSGNYHPHGEQVVYPTLVRMAQNFNMRYPLIDGQGNFGSIDGDGPAAMRYTEARLTPIAMEILADMEKNTVSMMSNYDETRQEPRVLPGRFPNLLCNGTSGIAVGMASNIPPHNLGEIVDGLVAIIDDEETSNEKLLEIIPGPDFPTGGIINGRQGIRDAYRTGRGRIIVRDKVIDGISDLRDESDRDGMRIVVELKRDIPAEVVLNQLYKHTLMQSTFSAMLLTLVGGVPRVLSLREMLDEFIKHRHEVVVLRTRFDLEKAEARAHILEGYKIALDNIDAVIELIKKSKDTPSAREGLMKKFGLSEIQANAILEMRLARLTGLERRKIEEEYVATIKQIEELRGILESRPRRMAIIKEELLELKKKYADERRTMIQDEAEEFTVEDLIAEEDMVITISHAGYIKRLSVTMYRRQNRGGRGSRGIETREEDFAEHLFVASTHDYILFFSNMGQCYWVKVHEIPTGGRLARGKPIVNMLQLGDGEKITAFCKVRSFDPDKFIVMTTRQGNVKKTPLDAFSNPRKTGINAINLPEHDELIEAAVSDGTCDIVMATRKGQAIRFSEDKVRPMGRTAYGVHGIKLRLDDYVIGMVVVRRDTTIMTVTENGYGKRTNIADYRVTNRGGKGIINIKTSKRNGDVVDVKEVVEDDELILITRNGIAIRQRVTDIKVISRNTQGVRLIMLDKEDKVTDVARLAREE